MKLFELYAELGLNADKFNTGITAAKGSMLGLSNDVTSKASTIDDEITVLDRLIASLDEEISNLELDIETSKLEDEIKNLKKDIESQDFKSSFMKGFYEGLTDASTDIITELISKGFDFLGDSVKNASESGSAIADAYNKAFAKMELGSNNLSKAIGNKLLPALTSIYDILASVLGVSDTDLASSMLGQLNSYKFENLKQAEESLANIFSFGEAYKKPEESMDFSSVLAGIESQNQFWKDSINTVDKKDFNNFKIVSVNSKIDTKSNEKNAITEVFPIKKGLYQNILQITFLPKASDCNFKKYWKTAA